MWRCTLPVVLVACGRFDFDQVTGKDGSVIDARIPGDVLDAFSVPTIGARWVTTSETVGLVSAFVLHPLDDSGFGTACLPVVTDGAYPYMLGHPTLPYVWAVESDLEGIALSCAGDTITAVTEDSVSRAAPRVIVDVSAGVGFFTADGPGNSGGLYRFTFGADGVPTGNGDANAPGVGQPLALDPVDPSTSTLYLGAQSQLAAYTLGAGDTLVNAYQSGATCVAPMDIALSGDYVLSFCHDVPDIQRNARSASNPAPMGIAGSPGAFDAAVVLPHDRAVGSLSNPPQLIVLELGGGTATWVDGPMLPAGVAALAASADGTLVVAAWPTGALAATIAAWAVAGDQLVPLGQVTTGSVINSIAITPAS